MREEWKSNAPQDEQGTPLNYPRNPESAVRLIREAAGPEWGAWELTRHEVEVEFETAYRVVALALRVLPKIRRHRCSEFDVLENAPHFPCCLNRSRKLLIELRRVPVHLGQCKNIL